MALISNGDQVLTKNVYGSDETVLWEGETVVRDGNTFTFNLSENIGNFEGVKFVIHSNFGAGNNVAEHNVTANNNRFSIGTNFIVNSDGNALFCESCFVTFSGSVMTAKFGQRTGISLTTLTISTRSDRGPTVLKIIGINRKQTATQEGE